MVEHQIIRDHETNRSRGFGFVIFDNEEVVDEILTGGNMIDMEGHQVRLFKWSTVNPNLFEHILIKDHLYFFNNIYGEGFGLIFPRITSINCKNSSAIYL